MPPQPSPLEAPPASLPRADPGTACTLSADGMQERLAWIHREILPHRVATERLADGLALELVAAPGLRERLDHLIALERACCAPLVFERKAGASPDRLRLEIRGVDPDAAVFAPLRPPPAREPLGWRRLVRAAGLGSGATLLICCAAPVAAAALLGATAWLALETPLAIAGVWLLGTAAAWAWLGRRRKSPRAGGDRGCGGGPC